MTLAPNPAVRRAKPPVDVTAMTWRTIVVTLLPEAFPGPLGLSLAGRALSRGTISLIAPTDLITKTGQEMTIDGVTFTFQLTPGTEAPSEMNAYLPQFRGLSKID